MLTRFIHSLTLFSVFTAAAILSIETSAEQQDADYKYVKRYSTAGLLLGEFSPTPANGQQNRPAKRYFYSDPTGQDSRTSLLFLAEEGYLTGWAEESQNPSQWAFTAKNRTQYTYDQYGRKRTEGRIDSAGSYLSLTQYSYDERSRIACKAVRMNKSMLSPSLLPSDDQNNVYLGGACVLNTEGSDGPDRITKYVYDSLDNILEEHRAVGTDLEQVYVKYTYIGYQKETITDANFNTAKMEYDDFGRLYRWYFADPDAKLSYNVSDYEEYLYDNNGNRKSFRKRDESVFNYQYDAMNRMIKKDVPVKPANHPFNEDVFYGYDAQGLQLYAMFGKYGSSNHDGIGISTNYSGFGDVISETSNVGGSYNTAHSYDKHGNKINTTYHDNTVFNRTYNRLDRLTGITRGGVATLSYGYTPAGLPEWKTTASGASTTTLGYDDANRIDNIYLDLANLSNDLILGFGFNAASQVTEKTVSNSLYQHLDSNGNVGSYAVNGLNQYTSVNGVTYDWDANGNLTKDDKATYTYDKENRLVKVVGQGVTADLIYDPNGRLAQYKVSGTTTNFVYDGDVIISEYRSNGTHANYLHASTAGTPLVTYEYSGSSLVDTLYLHTNHQGSVIAASDIGGNLQQINTYDAYGVAGDLNLGRFGYTGQVWLAEVGLYNYRARAYRAEIGRFLQTDPVGYEDQMNLYAYVHNDPLSFTDPSGRESVPHEEKVYVTGKKTGGNDCDCTSLSGAAAQSWIRYAQEGAGKAQIYTFAAISNILGNSWMANEDPPDDDAEEVEEVEEEYDSLEAAVGEVNPLDEVEFEGKTKNPGLREQGFTEKWTGVNSQGEFVSAFKNPRTGKWTGGHSSSKNNKYW